MSFLRENRPVSGRNVENIDSSEINLGLIFLTVLMKDEQRGLLCALRCQRGEERHNEAHRLTVHHSSEINVRF